MRLFGSDPHPNVRALARLAPALLPSYPADTTAPVFSVNPSVSAVTDATANFLATSTDNAGGTLTHHVGVYAAGSSPTAAEVAAGTGTGYVSSTHQTASVASGAQATFPQVTGLSNGRQYRAAFTVADAAANLATVYYLDFYTTVGQASRAESDISSYLGTLYNPKTVTLTAVALRNGTVRSNLSNLRWSWYDGDDCDNLGSRIDHGTTGATDASGNIQFFINNSSLTSGQYGRLLVETNDKISLGHYRLAIP